MNSPNPPRVRLSTLLLGSMLAAALVSIPSSFGQGPQGARVVLSHGEPRYVGPAQRMTAVTARPGMKPAVATSARSALARYAPSFGLADPASQLQQIRSTSRGPRGDVVRYRQLYRGLPVIGGELVLSLDGAGQVLSLSGEVDSKLALADLTPRITGARAQEIAALATAKYRRVPKGELVADKPELSIYVPRLIGPRSVSPAQLVWRTAVQSKGTSRAREFVLVSAMTGGVVLHFDQVETARNRMTYTASGGDTTPGTLLCDETQPLCTGGANPDADTAHHYAGDMYDFYFSRFGRDSYDDLGAALISTVDYAPPNYCPNAAWIGTQMVYCAGAPAADDVVGHELTHAVTENTSGLFYYYQSGAINESLSDVFGEIMDLSNGTGTDTPEVRWKMGEDFTGVGAIRDMANPAQFGDPDRIGSPNYWTSPADGGGVHSNSGINNKAASLIVDGGSFNGYTVAGIGIDKAALIYYRVETQHLTSGSDYADLYVALNQACKNLIGTNGIVANDCLQVANATAAVEMNAEPALQAGTEIAACGINQVPVDAFYDDFEGPADPSRWTNTPIAGAGGSWFLVQGFAPQGVQTYFTPGSNQVADYALTMASSVVVPPNAFLHFRHAFEQESSGTENYDGGIVEYSTDDGVTWNNASAIYSAGQNYNGTIFAAYGNPLAGNSAFVGSSHGYVSTRYDLGALAGSNLRVRFRNGSDSSVATGLAWLVDEIRIYTCAADTSANTPPAAVAGADQTVSPRDSVTLDGSASSDDDGSIMASTWTQLSGPAVATSNVGRSLTFTAPSTPTQDDLVFRLTVTDNRGATTTDDVKVTVVNPQPQATAGSDQSSTPRTLVSLHGGATDSNGTIAGYRWTQTGGPAALVGKAFTTPVLVSNTQAVFVGTGPLDVGTTIMQLNFLPNGLTAAGGTVALNSASYYTVCTAVSGNSCSWPTGTQLGITGSVSAPASTGGATTWTLQGVQLSDGTPVQGSFKFDIATSTLSSISILAVGDSSKDVSFFAPSVPTTANLTFRLSVTDNDGGTGSDDLTVQVTNAQPTANAGADQSLHPRVAAALAGNCSDPDGSIVGYAWTQTAGPAVTITNANSASASFVTPSVAASATLTFQLTTTDNDGGTATDTLDVAVTNSPPTVAAGNDVTVNAGANVSLAATASDPDGSINAYNWTQSAGSPVTLTGNTTSNAQFRAPSGSTQSTYSFQVSVTDNDGATATDTVTVTVRASTGGGSSSGGGGGGGGAFDALTLGGLLIPFAVAWMSRRRRFLRP